VAIAVATVAAIGTAGMVIGTAVIAINTLCPTLEHPFQSGAD